MTYSLLARGICIYLVALELNLRFLVCAVLVLIYNGDSRVSSQEICSRTAPSSSSTFTYCSLLSSAMMPGASPASCLTSSMTSCFISSLISFSSPSSSPSVSSPDSASRSLSPLSALLSNSSAKSLSLSPCGSPV